MAMVSARPLDLGRLNQVPIQFIDRISDDQITVPSVLRVLSSPFSYPFSFSFTLSPPEVPPPIVSLAMRIPVTTRRPGVPHH